MWYPNYQTAISLIFGATTNLRSQCRCLHAEPCWPSTWDFASLSTQLSQPLIYPSPPESACYPSLHSNSNSSESETYEVAGNCTEVRLHTLDGNWRSNQAGSMQAPNFQTSVFVDANGSLSISACYLNTSLGIPCQRGSVSPVGVDARSVEDVQAAVRFAMRYNLRLVVKNTGHDFLGRSSAKGSFMLWTHHMKDITYSSTFIPEGGPAGVTYNALTLGAGVQWHEAYDAAHLHRRFLVGGLTPGGSVGAAGGWVMGGGHSAFSAKHGLGVDNVLQFTIVTSSGNHLSTNAYSHPDLFWALRGGGGGTYGVVTSVTYRTHEDTHLTGIILSSNFSSPSIAQSVVAEFLRTFPSLADAGWGGYTSISAHALQFFGVAPNISWAEANATIDPLFKFVRDAEQDTQALTIPFESFYDWYERFFASGMGAPQVGANEEIASRLLSRDLVESKYKRVAETLLGLEGGVLAHFIAGGAVTKVDSDHTGLNPARGKALVHVVVGEGWKEGTPANEIRELEGRLKRRLGVLDTLAGPDSGAYLNEASLYEEDFQKTFFGEHYEKLKAIKDDFDPVGLFVVAEGVGSEEWDNDLNCRKQG